MQKSNRLLATLIATVSVCTVAMADSPPVHTAALPQQPAALAVPLSGGNAASPAPAQLLGQAQDDTSNQAPSAANTLDQLKTEEAILAEQLKVVQLQEKIAEARGGLPTGSGRQTGSMMAPAAVVMLPSVKAIEGLKGIFSAIIIYGDGSTLKVRVGSHLSDGSLVLNINEDGVLVHTAVGDRVLPMATPVAAGGGATPSNGLPLQAPPLQVMPPPTDSSKQP